MEYIAELNLDNSSPFIELYQIANRGNFWGFEKVLYHYTSPEGLLGITDGKEIKLFFTQYTALNDISEGNVLKERYINVCNRLYKEGIIKSNIKDKMISRIASGLSNKYRRIAKDGTIEEFDMEDLFVCSFSKNGDSLPMWNYYVKNGGYQGYNLGLISPYSHCNISDDILLSRIRPFEVHYTEDDLYKQVFHVAKELNDVGEQEELFKAKLNTLFYYLSFCKLLHKSEYFAHEEEVRLVFLIGKDEKELIKYRTKNGVLIPYLEIGFFTEALKEITIGPLMEKELAVKNLKGYLDQKGYKDFIIKSSRAPIRY